MSVRKICRAKGCKVSPRCDHLWWFDTQVNGRRWRMPVNDFAFKHGATALVKTKQEAEQRWEPRFKAAILAGEDPRVPPGKTPEAATLTVAGLLDLYMVRHVHAVGLRSAKTIEGLFKAVKAHMGELPASRLEKPDDLLAFKAQYQVDRTPATVNRALANVRAAVNWAMHQHPPLLTRNPFHRFGVAIRPKDEFSRSRRVGIEEEQRLLAACGVMNSAEHRWVGESMHDRLIGAVETCCRKEELRLIQNRHVDWEACQIAIPAAHTKDKENRRIPFEPDGRLAQVLRRRAALGPACFVFGTPAGEYQRCFRTAFASLVLIANGHKPTRAKRGGRVSSELLAQIDLHWHDLRREGACRLLSDGLDVRSIQQILGHADIRTTQRYLNITDEELLRGMTGMFERRRARIQAVAN